MASMALLHALAAVMTDGISGTAVVPGMARCPMRSATRLPLESPRSDAMVAVESRGTAAMSTLSAIVAKARGERGAPPASFGHVPTPVARDFFPFLICTHSLFTFQHPAIRDFFPLHRLHSFSMDRVVRTECGEALAVASLLRFLEKFGTLEQHGIGL